MLAPTARFSHDISRPAGPTARRLRLPWNPRRSALPGSRPVQPQPRGASRRDTVSPGTQRSRRPREERRGRGARSAARSPAALPGAPPQPQEGFAAVRWAPNSANHPLPPHFCVTFSKSRPSLGLSYFNYKISMGLRVQTWPGALAFAGRGILLNYKLQVLNPALPLNCCVTLSPSSNISEYQRIIKIIPCKRW